jgi:hypothetical protein
MNDTSTTIAHSVFSRVESGPDTDPESAFWSAAPAILFAADTHGAPQPDLSTEVRSRWTFDNLYLLFTCAYDANEPLNLKPDPDLEKETNELWNWDVVEVFLGADANNIRRYKEFEISPQGEWVALDVDLAQPNHEEGRVWTSDCETAARIDPENPIWYAFLRIPYGAIDSRAAASGNTLRINLCRVHGTKRRLTVWQPTMCATFHVPDVFGTLRLEKA